MKGKYVYIPANNIVFKEYKTLSDFMKSLNKPNMKPISYTEYQILKADYSFNEIINIIVFVCSNGECMNLYNTIKKVIYERGNIWAYSI